MNNVPNLDAMTRDELMTFWMQHQRGRGYKALLGSGRGRMKATAFLACYASNVATALACRLRGDISTACMYERIADNIYAKLPDYAKW